MVLSIPLGYFAGIGTCSKKGILIKGSNYLDGLNNIDTIVFDKTGTLTKGIFTVSKIVSVSELKEEEIIKYIATCETFSNHPIAKSITGYYKKVIDQQMVKKHSEISGKGIKASINDQEVLVGNYKLLDKNNIKYKVPKEIGTIIYLAMNDEYKGYVIVADELKTDSKKTISELKKIGVKNIIMLTGDNNLIAKQMARELNLTHAYGELLPEDKVDILKEIKETNNQGNVIFVGDGINDGPALATIDIAISMSSGSDLAIEAADIALMTSEPAKIIEAINIAKQTRKIVVQNIIFAIAIKVIFLILSAFGYTNMWQAVFSDVGVSSIAVLNATRIMKLKK